MCVAPLWDPQNKVPRPCGACSECLVKKSTDWALRGFLHNSVNTEKLSVFMTFTYDEEHNPGVVCKPVAQLLKKRFGYHIGLGCKSILTGEYGEVYGRPHYHMAVWLEPGCNFDYNIGDNDSDAYNPPDDLWPYGKIDVRPLTPERIAYTCGYELKNGRVKPRDRKRPDGCYLPFTLFSQGIAKEYAQKFGKRDMELGFTPMRGFKKPVSRYVQNHSGHCETYNKIWRLRKNSKIDFKFNEKDYFPEEGWKRFMKKHPKGAVTLPWKKMLHEIKIDDMITSSKNDKKRKAL